MSKWRVTASNGRTGKRIGETFVEAHDKWKAIDIGKAALKIMLRLPGRPQYNASQYYPERDAAFSGYIKEATP